MSDRIRDLLDAMQARCDAATEEPWESDDTDPSIWGPKVIVVGNYTAADGYDSPAWEDGSPDDRAFIAAARTDLPRLIAAVRAVLERACMEQDDAEYAMTYAAEIDDGLMLASQQARKQAWADAARAITTALGADDD